MFFGVYGVYGMLRCGFPHIKMTHLWRIYEHTAALRDRRAASALVVLALASGPARRKGNPTGCLLLFLLLLLGRDSISMIAFRISNALLLHCLSHTLLIRHVNKRSP